MPSLGHAHAGSWQTFRSIDLDETEEAVKTGPGHLGGWHIWNDSAAVHYVHFYDATTTAVTVGTSTPKMTLGIPATGGACVMLPQGIEFETAITAACTTAVGGTGNPAANDCVITVFYY